MNKKRLDYAFNAKLMTLLPYIIAVVIFIILEAYIHIIYITGFEIILWIILTIEDIKISLLNSICENIRKENNTLKDSK